ncbi:hypothetical protein FRC02_001783 [Tulasnella sp. 418]|nr:hypothetical protein FRC02_001783 [Tulasnella sp. 418]
MFELLSRLLLLKKGVNLFINLADESDKVPKLSKKLYSDFRLSSQEWATLKLIHEVLETPHAAQATFSSETQPTV